MLDWSLCRVRWLLDNEQSDSLLSVTEELIAVSIVLLSGCYLALLGGGGEASST